MDEIPNFFSRRHAYELAQSDEASRRDTQRNNSTRPAVTEITYLSTGTGQHRVASTIIFPIIFRTEPHFTTGSAVVRNPDPKRWHDPVGICGVYAWKRDPRGHFIGANIWVRVEMHPINAMGMTPPPNVTCQHYMTFSGIAFKDITSTTMYANVQPRTVGL